MWPVARGSIVGGRTPRASYAALKARVLRSASAQVDVFSAAALMMILSSMSVTLRTHVTSYPEAISQRRSTSKATALRTCPTCGGDCTVGPHK
jgi:hypothetical protein